jgi:ATP-binding cassette subfamily B protein
MDNTAFARARKFLNYHPVAQWLAIISSVLTAILFFALLLLLALVVDLVVNRGEVPPYWQLSPTERSVFGTDTALPEDPDAAAERRKADRETLRSLGLNETELKMWFEAAPGSPPPVQDRALLWYVDAIQYANDAVGEEAAGVVRDRVRRNIETQRSLDATHRSLDAALNQPIRDVGLLSRVIRSRGTLTGWLTAKLAAWNSWTWIGGDASYLLGLFVLAVAITVVRFVLLFVSKYAAALACLEAVTRLRRAVYLHTNRLGTLALQPFGTTEAVGASNRHLEFVHESLYRWLTVFFREPVKALLLLLFALLVSPWLAIAFVMFALLMWIAGSQISARLRRQGRAAQRHTVAQLGLIEESLTLTRLVKVYLMEAFNQARVERQLRSYADAQRARYFREALYRPLYALLGFLAGLVLLFAAGYVIVQGHLGVASAAVLAAALVSLYWPVRAMLDTRRSLRRGREAARALFAFLDRQGGVGQPIEAEFLQPLSQALELDKVTLLEPETGRKLLRSVSLRIEAGQRVAIVGPDALEKQAFISLLPRFTDPTNGEVRIDGKNLRWVTLDSLRTQMGLVLQQNLTFTDTVANNIGCGDPAYNLQRIIEAAKTAHAHQFIQKLPQGYETVIGEAGHALTTSEMYRIALARAILREPAIYVIEEPEGTLDDDTKALIDDTMQRILPGRTVVFLPQRLSTIRHCDQVFLLHQGRIAASGEHRELLATSDLYKHLQYLQFNEFAGLFANHNQAPASPSTPVVEESRS